MDSCSQQEINISLTWDETKCGHVLSVESDTVGISLLISRGIHLLNVILLDAQRWICFCVLVTQRYKEVNKNLGKRKNKSWKERACQPHQEQFVMTVYII